MNLFPSLLRGDTAAGWRSRNPVLPAGVFGFEQVDVYTARAKLGDGGTRWKDLPYFGTTALPIKAGDLDGGGA
jgi:hypothetical protein